MKHNDLRLGEVGDFTGISLKTQMFIKSKKHSEFWQMKMIKLFPAFYLPKFFHKSANFAKPLLAEVRLLKKNH